MLQFTVTAKLIIDVPFSVHQYNTTKEIPTLFDKCATVFFIYIVPNTAVKPKPET